MSPIIWCDKPEREMPLTLKEPFDTERALIDFKRGFLASATPVMGQGLHHAIGAAFQSLLANP